MKKLGISACDEVSVSEGFQSRVTILDEPTESARPRAHQRFQTRIAFTSDRNDVGENEEDFAETEEELRLSTGRLALSKIAHHVETKQFVFCEQYSELKQKRNISKEVLLDHIDENLGQFSREPSVGIQPNTIDIGAYSRHRSRARYKTVVPFGFGPGERNQMKLRQKKALRLYENVESEKRVDHVSELLTKDSRLVEFIVIQGIDLSESQFTDFNVISKLSSFRACVVLVLKGANLGDELASLHLPCLRVLDVSSNEIHDVSVVSRICERSPGLEGLVVEGNPFVAADGDWKDKLLVRFGKSLSWIDDTPVKQEEVENAIKRFGEPEQKQNVMFERFRIVLGEICTGCRLDRWDPGRITTLCVAKAALQEFHVGGMPCLRILDISENEIRRLKKAGLEKLDDLQQFNFAQNDISEKSELEPLFYLPSIRSIECSENKFEEREAKIRSYIIYLTRGAKGTNRCPGIVSVNGIDVEINERIEASVKFAESPEERLQNRYMKWSFLLIKEFGHFQLRCVPHFSNRIKILRFPRVGLEHIDLAGFRRLEFLDLHANSLKSVEGLPCLLRLKYVNLCGNFGLNMDLLLEDLCKIANLHNVVLAKPLHEQVASESLAILGGLGNLNLDLEEEEEEGEVRDPLADQGLRLSTIRKEKRQSVLRGLIPKHSRLYALNEKEITFDERVDAYSYAPPHMAPRLNAFQLRTYRFNLAITMQACRIEQQKYSFKTTQFHRPERIGDLRLSGFGLEDSGCRFQPFRNLELLDLSENKLEDVSKLGLDRCRKLRVIDLRNNNIQNTEPELEEFFNHFPSIEVIALDGNPCAKAVHRNRLEFLKKLDVMKSAHPCLQVLDSDITNDERHKVKEFHGIVKKTNDRDKFRQIVGQLGYYESPGDVKKVSLIGCLLQKLFLDPFVNVSVLLLRGNLLRNLAGIGHLDRIRVLDVRNNELDDVDEIVERVNALPKLQCLGFSGNCFADDEDHPIAPRQWVIGNVPKLRKPFSRFWEIDEKPITVDEIVESWSVVDRTDEEANDLISRFRFDRQVFRKYATYYCSNKVKLADIRVVSERIKQLNLGNSSLRVMNFSPFENLKKLSLRGNALVDDSILSSSLIQCSKLEELDLSANDVRMMSTFHYVIDTLERLRSVDVDENPCFPQEEQDSGGTYRRKLIANLKTVESVNFGLNTINAIDVTVDERCLAIRSRDDVSIVHVDLLRTKLVLHEAGYGSHVTEISLPEKGLTRIDMLLEFSNLTRLELQENALKTLPALMMRLEQLTYLDLRNNDLTAEKILDSLKLNKKLSLLFVKGNIGLSNPATYIAKIFRTMRGLKSLDGYFNPWNLSNDELLAVSYLEKKFDLSRNSLLDIDLRHQHIERDTFWPIILALNSLTEVIDDRRQPQQGIEDEDDVRRLFGPKTLLLNEGNFNESFVAFDRFVVISHLGSLEMLDDQEITEAERQTAQETMRKLDNKLLEKRKENRYNLKDLSFLQSSLDFTRVRKHCVSVRLQIPDDGSTNVAVERELDELPVELPSRARNAAGAGARDSGEREEVIELDELPPRAPRQRVDEEEEEGEDIRVVRSISHSGDEAEAEEEEGEEEIRKRPRPSRTPSLPYDKKLLAELTRGGVWSEIAAKHALIATDNLSAVKATEWLLLHNDEIDPEAAIEGDFDAVSDVSDEEAEEGSGDGDGELKRLSTLKIRHMHPNFANSIVSPIPEAGPGDDMFNLGQSSSDETVVSSNDEEEEALLSEVSNKEVKLRDIRESDVDFLFIETNFERIPIFRSYTELLNETNHSVRSLGNIVEKLGQVIYFMQMFAIIFAFNIPWPQGFRAGFEYFSFSVFGFENIGTIREHLNPRVHLLRYVMVLPIPLVLFVYFIWSCNRHCCSVLFVRLRFLSVFGLVVLLLLGFVLAVVLAFCFDTTAGGHTFYPQTWYNLFPPTLGNDTVTTVEAGPTLQWFVIFFSLALLNVFLFFFVLTNIIVFNCTLHDSSFWNSFFVDFRRRIAFFFLTISYFALMRTIFVAFECDADHPFIEVQLNSTLAGTTLRLFDEPCPSFQQDFLPWISGLPAVYWVSFFFALFYGLGIPIVFAFMVARDWGHMFNHFSLDREDTKLAAAKEAWKLDSKDAARKKDYRDLLKENAEKYHKAAVDFNSAPSFLYAPFKRFFRFYKIFFFVERFFLCFIASALYGGDLTYAQIWLAFAVEVMFLVMSIVCRVYVDLSQNIIDIANRVAIILTLFFGFLLLLEDRHGFTLFGPENSWLASAFLYSWSVGAIVITVVALLIPVIRCVYVLPCWCCRKDQQGDRYSVNLGDDPGLADRIRLEDEDEVSDSEDMFDGGIGGSVRRLEEVSNLEFMKSYRQMGGIHVRQRSVAKRVLSEIDFGNFAG